MKRVLLTCASVLACIVTQAQNANEPYEVSVFRNATATTVNSTAIAKEMQKAQHSFPGWSVETDKINSSIRDLFGPAIAIPGATIDEKVQTCITTKLKDLGLNADNWIQTRNSKVGNAIYADYVQSFGGHKVVFSRLSFRFTADERLVRIQIRNYGTPAADAKPTITDADVLRAAMQDVTGVTVTSTDIDKNWEWFPIPTANGYVLHPAMQFNIAGTTQDKNPVMLWGYVDATNGTLLYRHNKVETVFDLTVKGTVYKDGATSPASLQPLAHLKVTVGSTDYYTDTAGYVNVTSIPLPATANVSLSGLWSKVVDYTTNSTPAYSTPVSVLGSTYTFPTTAPSSERHVNAYYHVNKVHDFMKGYYPTFTGMDYTLPTNVDLNTGTCNAFYNGSSINFYAAGGGCSSFANIGTVVYHEYGHGISDKYYNMIKGGGTINNGGMNEGNSDVWAMCVSHSPIVGEGSSASGTGYIRRYDMGAKVLPNDLTGESHANGEIIAGAWWDVAVNLGSVDSMSKLFTSTYNDVPDGPNGTEAQVYHDVLISALMNDDTDANINNGTPHFVAIVKAFARHGIYLLSATDFLHNELAHQPDGTAIPVTATVTAEYPFFLQDVRMFYKIRGTTTWDTITMTASGANYSATIPAQAKGILVDYYFSIRDTMNMTEAYFPANYSPANTVVNNTLPYQFGVGIRSKMKNDFETNVDGWQVGLATDTATSGKWIWAIPIMSRVISNGDTFICQTGNDHTSGTGRCLVTGNAATIGSSINNADVDNGNTTVMTPGFNLSGFFNPVIEYYRWYGNDRGNNPKQDLWLVQLRTDSTATVWKNVDQTYQSDYSWRRRIFAVKEYTTARNFIQLRFVATDPKQSTVSANGQSTVEAALDDFAIYDLDWPDAVPALATNPAEIYPNPANDKLKVVLPAGVNGSMTLYDMTGRAQISVPLSDGVTVYELNVSNMPAGQYFLLFNGTNVIRSQKLVIKH